MAKPYIKVALITCSSPHLSEDYPATCRPLEPEWSCPQTELPEGQMCFMFQPPHNGNLVSLRSFDRLTHRDLSRSNKGHFLDRRIVFLAQ